jgi:hypothetical protein
MTPMTPMSTRTTNVLYVVASFLIIIAFVAYYMLR